MTSRARVQWMCAGGMLALLGLAGCSREREVNEPAVTDDTVSWCVGPSMLEARYRPQVVQLLDGRILVIAGRGAHAQYLASAEIFDPATNTWKATGSLATARYYHRATLLSDGRVLVTGGVSPAGPLASAELYDPATGLWTAAPSMITSRREHIAFELSPGVVMIAGGGNPFVPLVTTVETLALSGGQWEQGTDLPGGFGNAVVTGPLPDGSRYALGGYANDGYASRHVARFSAKTNSWENVAPLLTARDYSTASVVGGDSLFVVGGFQDDSTVLGSTEFYDSHADRWTAGPPLNTATMDHRAVSLPSGRILILGGLTAGFQTSARTEVYEPARGAFVAAAPLHTKRYGSFALRLNDGRVMIGGGAGTYGAVDESWLSSVEISCQAIK